MQSTTTPTFSNHRPAITINDQCFFNSGFSRISGMSSCAWKTLCQRQLTSQMWHHLSAECDWAWHELASIWCEALVHPSSHVRWRVVTTITTTCVRRRERVNQSGGRHMMVMAVKGCARNTTTIQSSSSCSSACWRRTVWAEAVHMTRGGRPLQAMMIGKEYL